MTIDTLISICVFLGGFIGLTIWSIRFVSQSKADREALFKKKVVTGLWCAGTMLVLFPGFLARYEYIHVGWFLAGTYTFLFFTLPFFYWVERERTRLRWETRNQKRASRGQLGSCLLMYGVSILFTTPMVYNYYYGGLSWEEELILSILLIITVYFANKLRTGYINNRYKSDEQNTEKQ